jgi:hypothetical protein
MVMVAGEFTRISLSLDPLARPRDHNGHPRSLGRSRETSIPIHFYHPQTSWAVPFISWEITKRDFWVILH